MDRLTSQRVNGIKTGYWSPAKKEDVVQRLGAYEDTGLTPEEIKDMARLRPVWRRPTDVPLPPIGERVLVARQKEKGTPLVVEQATRELGGWWKVYGTNVKRIVAWRPMPLPPKLPE